MKLLVTSFLLCFACLVNAQSADELVGKWGFDRLPDSVLETMDAESKEISKKMFGDLMFEFGAHGECHLTLLGRTETGKYTYDEETTTITMIDQLGDQMLFDVESYDAETNEMVIKGDKMHFVLSK